MHMEKHLPQSWRRSKVLWAVLAALAVVLILVIVVPCAVIIPRNKHHIYSASVILPLYIYPSNDSSWAPLFNAAKDHPQLNFTVIVNPSSGPGSSALPNSDYAAAVEKLNGYDNVRTVGYVRTGYATRNVTDVIDEVNTYAGWSSNSSSLAMHGIFFDEAPHQYTQDAVDFMTTVDKAAKSATGLKGDKTIIHNPGTVPDTQFSATSPDITVIFEHNYTSWQSTQEAAVKDVTKTNRTSYSLMVTDVPSMSNSTLTDLVEDLSSAAEYLFITGRESDYYEYFGADWDEFVAAMASNTEKTGKSN